MLFDRAWCWTASLSAYVIAPEENQVATYQDSSPAREPQRRVRRVGPSPRWRARGVEQLQQNVPSVLAVGGLGQDRTGVVPGSGQRWVQTSPVGRSAQTREAAPQYEQTP